VIWLFALLAVLVIGGLVVLAVVRGAQSQPAYDDRPEVRLPADRPLRADDLAAVRFTTAARGYRMAEVDALLARLRAEMAERESGFGAARDPGDVTAPLSQPADPAEPHRDDTDGQ
jgi:DivIVA domain-containing protein